MNSVLDRRTVGSRSAGPGSGSLARRLGLVGLAATGICSMLGAGINVVPFMIQRSVPGIGPWVLPAYLVAAVPALLAALAYAVLASAMPRAGGSYIFASRTIGPYWGFVASFSQWFGLSMAIGVVSYVLIPFLRDIAASLAFERVAVALDTGGVRVVLALGFIWLFAWVNVRGAVLYERLLVPMMVMMFVFGAVVIVAGFRFDQTDFAAALAASGGGEVPQTEAQPLGIGSLLAAVAVLFSSFIGFDSIAQAGGEAKNPRRNLPLAIGLAIGIVGGYYLIFTAAVYHAVPWAYIAEKAQTTDLTAPGLLGILLSPGWTVAIVAGAAIALINDLPAMLLAVSRLMYAWAADGIFPRLVARVHRRWHTPYWAIVLSAGMASCGVIGCELAGDFFLGVDILVTSMLVNFLLMCLSVVALQRRRPQWAAESRVPLSPTVRWLCAVFGAGLLLLLLGVHLWKDLALTQTAWYLRSTTVWIGVMAIASVIFWREISLLRRAGEDLETLFAELPPEGGSP